MQFTIDKTQNHYSVEVDTQNASITVYKASLSVEYDADIEETAIEVFDGMVWVSYYGKTAKLEKGDSLRINPSLSEQTLPNKPVNEPLSLSEYTDNQDEEQFVIERNYQISPFDELSSSDVTYNFYVTDKSFRGEGPSTYFYAKIKLTDDLPFERFSYEFCKNYIETHGDELRKFFKQNKAQVLRDFQNENETPIYDVTDWFPETVTVNDEDGDFTYKISGVSMSWILNQTGKNNLGNLSDDYYFDGYYYRYLSGFRFNFYGNRV